MREKANSVGRRQFLAGSGVAALCFATWPAAAANQGGLVPPIPKRVADVRRQLGRTRTDYYSWMKFVPAEGQRTLANLPPAVREHLQSENRYARSVLALGQATEDRHLAAMLARLSKDIANPPLRRGDWLYWHDFQDGRSHPVYRRKHAATGAAQILLDENERAAGQPYFRTTGHQISPDGRLFAWAEDVAGNDRHRLCVRDPERGETRTIVETDAYGYGGLTFSPSSHWLFWIRRDARNRPTRFYRSPVMGGLAVLVYEEHDPAIFMAVERTAADGFVAITLSGPDTSEVRLIRAAAEEAGPVIVRARRTGVRYTIDEWDGALVSLEESEAALDGRVVRLDPASFAVKNEIVPHRPGTQIVQLASFARALLRLERHDGRLRLMLTRPGQADTPIALGGDGLTPTLPAGQDYHGPACRISVEGLATPPRWIDVALSSGTPDLISAQAVPNFDHGGYEVLRLDAPSPDGERVPVTLLRRKGTPDDGRAPLMLYGYGAYGISSDPVFSIPPTVLVDQGWNYAIAHVRGGSERGRRWFLDGRRDRKHNSFVDFVAAARHLCKLGHGAEGKVVAYGLSAGGLLVAAAMNRAPELWAGVIAKVPFVDMLNTMSDASHPLVPLFRPDWGDPLAAVADYDYIASISPYENVCRAPYPPLLTTAGLKDDRVGYWEPAKLVAAVRHESTSKAPALLLTDMDAGHQGSGDRADEMKEMARFHAFAQLCVEGTLR